MRRRRPSRACARIADVGLVSRGVVPALTIGRPRPTRQAGLRACVRACVRTCVRIRVPAYSARPSSGFRTGAFYRYHPLGLVARSRSPSRITSRIARGRRMRRRSLPLAAFFYLRARWLATLEIVIAI